MSIDTPEVGAAAPQAQEQPVFRLTITQVTSYLFVTTRKTLSFVGTPDELKRQYRKVRFHNLMLGWWGIPAGFIWTPRSLLRNAKALKQLDQISASPAPPAPPAPTAAA